jgi:hypothetical protein
VAQPPRGKADHRPDDDREHEPGEEAADQQRGGHGDGADVGHGRFGQGQGEQDVAHDQPRQAGCRERDRHPLQCADGVPPSA